MRAATPATLIGAAALLLAACSSTVTGTPHADPSALLNTETTGMPGALPTETSTDSMPGAVDAPTSIPRSRAALPTRPTPFPAQVSCQYPDDAKVPTARPATKPAGTRVPARGTATAMMTTTAGAITLTLDKALAPCTVNSFVSLAHQGYFNNTPCHRLTTGATLQVLQCGDPSGKGTGGPGYSFKDEVFPGLTYGRGTVAMANAGPNTNGSQFFIVYGNAATLPPSYTVFGSVDDPGLQVVDRVAQAGARPDNGPGDGAPVLPVTVDSITVAG